MPGSYLIDVAHSLVFSRGWGVVTDASSGVTITK